MDYLMYGLVINLNGNEQNDYLSVVTNWTAITGHSTDEIVIFRPIISIF